MLIEDNEQGDRGLPITVEDRFGPVRKRVSRGAQALKGSVRSQGDERG